MDLGLQDRVALVTGASRGLGRAAAEALAAEGASLAICSHSEAIEQAAEAMRSRFGRPLLAMRADVARKDDVDRFVEQAAKTYGRIDILIINAGGPKPGPFLDLAVEDWEAAVRLCLMSVVYLSYAVIPHMVLQGSGSLIASESYSVKQPIENLVLSNSVRMAVVGLMKSLAGELGPKGIRVNSIHPGWTTTERVVHLFEDRARRAGTTPESEAEKIVRSIPLGRMGTVEEYGRAVAWLASPAASFVHGHALFLD
ncbi:MAG TPA: SDR family oxidoreductase, partial [Anaerolineales bacterium]|nr:SDR family oxidoreductase [Anaerolineales bacterium]